MTWELLNRSDQSLVATLSDRRPGAKVVVPRGGGRTAECTLDLNDSAAQVASVGDKLLRVTVAGWTDPLFIGRVAARRISFDDDEEAVRLEAVDPWAHLQRCIILHSGLFSGGKLSYKPYSGGSWEVPNIIRDLISTEAGNGHGIILGNNVTGSGNIGGFGAPHTVADDGSVGSIAWTNADVAHLAGADGSAVYCNPSPGAVGTHWLKATNWGFNIPAGATINGINVGVRRWRDGIPQLPYIADWGCKLTKAGAFVGADRVSPLIDWGTTPIFDSRGGAADLWGTTWTPAEINNSGFGVGLTAQSYLGSPGVGSFGTSSIAYVDYIKIAVYYTTAEGWPAVSNIYRDVSYPAGSNVADNIKSLVSLDYAAEWELVPKVGADGRIAQFDQFNPRQGADKTASVILKVGIDATDNALSFAYEPAMDAMVNRHTAIGDVGGTVNEFGLDWPIHTAYTANHAASQALYGIWESAEVLAGTTDPGLIKASAEAVVAANAYPLASFAMELDPETGPEVKQGGGAGTLWTGDKIAAQAGLPGATLNVQGRVGQIDIEEDDNRESDVHLVLEPDASSGVVSTISTVIVDASDGTVPPPPPEPDFQEPKKKDSNAKAKKKAQRRKRKAQRRH